MAGIAVRGDEVLPTTLADLRVYPSFLRTGLRALPETIEHIVQKDGDA